MKITDKLIESLAKNDGSVHSSYYANMLSSIYPTSEITPETVKKAQENDKCPYAMIFGGVSKDEWHKLANINFHSKQKIKRTTANIKRKYTDMRKQSERRIEERDNSVDMLIQTVVEREYQRHKGVVGREWEKKKQTIQNPGSTTEQCRKAELKFKVKCAKSEIERDMIIGWAKHDILLQIGLSSSDTDQVIDWLTLAQQQCNETKSNTDKIKQKLAQDIYDYLVELLAPMA